MRTERRQFLSATAFILAGVSVGAVSLTGCDDVQSVVPPGLVRASGMRDVEFGWSIPRLNNASAHAYFRVMGNFLMSFAVFDASYTPSTADTAAGSAQALCRAWVSRGGVPKFSGDLANPANASADFGSISTFNPDKLTVTSDAAPIQDVLYSIILRSWVSPDGAASQAARNVSAQPSLPLYAGDYLVFGIDHAGVPGSVDVQAVLGYL